MGSGAYRELQTAHWLNSPCVFQELNPSEIFSGPLELIDMARSIKGLVDTGNNARLGFWKNLDVVIYWTDCNVAAPMITSSVNDFGQLSYSSQPPNGVHVGNCSTN